MRVEEELAQFLPREDMLLTIGVFDGVHLGHRHLISKLVELARKQNLLSGVITFRKHPRELFSPQMSLPYLTTIAEREQLLKKQGVDTVVVLPFDKELSRLNAREFVGLLKKHLRMRGLVVGPDFALGKNREGNVDTLRSLGKETDFAVTIVPPRKIDGEIVSSTAIRNALTEGDMGKVTRLLGRPFSLQGKVISGEHHGAKLGFPTANLSIDPKIAVPPDGVYATRVYIDGREYQAMVNIGRRPTFGEENERTIESYIMNYKQDLYGKEVKIEVIQRLRDEKYFNNIDELKKQIAEDVKRGSEILNM
ncbi:MAG: bifunctional riboflavin kinase/FAD synthetase [Chloroflexi bacterium]|nr:bifunctional riboflavin kinase/FAD synthetase [Chloroflexota bacterium]